MNRVLIIKDDSDIRLSIRYALEKEGDFTVSEAADGARGLELVLKSLPDLLLLDLNLPGTPGLTWLEEVARDRPGLARRTLVITGRQLDRELVERLARCGAGVLAKPFTLDGLQTAVRAQIDRPGSPGPR